MLDEVEEATLSLLPGDVPIANSTIRVQPDVLVTSSSTYTFVEAKRIRPSSFQTDQLARELILTVQQAGERVPLLLVTLGSPPPVRVNKIPGPPEVYTFWRFRAAHVGQMWGTGGHQRVFVSTCE